MKTSDLIDLLAQDEHAGRSGRWVLFGAMAVGFAIALALTEMLLPSLAVTASSAGVHAAMEARLTRALGHTFLQEVDRRLAASGAGIIVLTEADTASDLRVSLADKADHLLGRALRPPEQLLLRRRS